MRSIWTRIREEDARADSVSIQGSGGGEGAPVQPAAPAPEVKPADPIKTEPTEQKVEVVTPEAKVETVLEVKPAENLEAPIPAEIPAKAPETEIKAEVNTVVESKIEAETKAEVDSKPAVENAAKAEEPVTAEAPKVAEVHVSSQAPAPAEVKEEKLPEVKQDDVSNGNTSEAQKELPPLQKTQEVQKAKSGSSEDNLKMNIKVNVEEIDLLKARVRNLETELQAALSRPGAKNHEMIESIKQQHEDLLSKARGMIFDKTKMVKNQELQIEALNTQVQSLKDINLITKDLLEIRNSEIKAMEDRLIAMEARFKAEKDRYNLVLERAQTSSNINDDLKQEYITQLKIFKELRLKYEQKVEALVAENNKLKLDLARNGGGPSAATPQ